MVHVRYRQSVNDLFRISILLIEATFYPNPHAGGRRSKAVLTPWVSL